MLLTTRAFLGLYSPLNCCSGCFPRVRILSIDGPLVQSFFCTSSVSFMVVVHVWQSTPACVFLTMFAMGSPSRQGHPLQRARCILTLGCVFLIFKLLTYIHRKEEGEDAITASGGPGALLRLHHEEFRVTKGRKGCIFFLLIRNGASLQSAGN